MAFTSTCMMPIVELESALKDDRDVIYAFVKKKAYVRITTSLGDLNCELHAEYVPKTVENFVKLCQTGYYNGTVFHRNIRSFIIQGGDPTGTGTGGESFWGGKIKDEFKKGHLMHNKRGIISMANSGPDTNGSQFFITYAPCQHLDAKHSVFGRVVGGNDVLREMETSPTEKRSDRPITDIKILGTEVFVDPYPEAEENLRKARMKDDIDSGVIQPESGKPKRKVQKAYGTGIGKYINRGAKRQEGDNDNDPEEEAGGSKKKKKKSGLSDFSEW